MQLIKKVSAKVTIGFSVWVSGYVNVIAATLRCAVSTAVW